MTEHKKIQDHEIGTNAWYREAYRDEIYRAIADLLFDRLITPRKGVELLMHAFDPRGQTPDAPWDLINSQAEEGEKEHPSSVLFLLRTYLEKVLDCCGDNCVDTIDQKVIIAEAKELLEKTHEYRRRSEKDPS